MKTKNPLTRNESYHTYSFRKDNRTPTKISRILGRHKTNIYLELKLNQGGTQTTERLKHFNLLLNSI